MRFAAPIRNGLTGMKLETKGALSDSESLLDSTPVFVLVLLLGACMWVNDCLIKFERKFSFRGWRRRISGGSRVEGDGLTRYVAFERGFQLYLTLMLLYVDFESVSSNRDSIFKLIVEFGILIAWNASIIQLNRIWFNFMKKRKSKKGKTWTNLHVIANVKKWPIRNSWLTNNISKPLSLPTRRGINIHSQVLSLFFIDDDRNRQKESRRSNWTNFLV